MEILNSPRRITSRLNSSDGDKALPAGILSSCYDSPKRAISRFSSHSTSHLTDLSPSCYDGSEQSVTEGKDHVSVYYSPRRSPRRKHGGDGGAAAVASPCKSTMSSICSSARRRVTKLVSKSKTTTSSLLHITAPPLDLDNTNHTTGNNNSAIVLTDTQATELCAKLQAQIDTELLPREEDLQARIQSEQELAHARFTNGSEGSALISLRKARTLRNERSRVTWAIDVAMDALWEMETKMARAKEKALRKNPPKAEKSSKKNGGDQENAQPDVHYKLNVGEHAHILNEIENILVASDHADDNNIDDGEIVLSDEDLLQELRDMVEAPSSS